MQIFNIPEAEAIEIFKSREIAVVYVPMVEYPIGRDSHGEVCERMTITQALLKLQSENLMNKLFEK